MTREKSAMAINVKSFIQAAAIILALMIVAGVLTRVLPSGAYQRETVNGFELVVQGSYESAPRPDYPVWRWFTAPAETLFGQDGPTLIVLMAFLLFVGGAFSVLERGGILKGMLSAIIRRFRPRRYLLMAILILFFMVSPSVLGIYEELVPAIVFIIPLSLALGWDSLVGLGMSLLALAFGFAASITNPFTVGVAQSIAGLPLYSASWFRLIFFLATYAAVFLFVFRYARKIERDPPSSLVWKEDDGLRGEFASGKESGAYEPMGMKLKRAVAWVSSVFGFCVLFIFVATRFKSVSTYVFPVVAFLFLVAGIGSGLISGMGAKKTAAALGSGALNMLGPVLLIMMAFSVKVIIVKGGILDTVLFYLSGLIQGAHPFVAVFIMYLVTLALEFFIASASAKAFLIMPILVPLSDLVGVTRQAVVVAYDLGDGFSNMVYPTNALLMIALGMTVVSFPKWLKWTLPIQGIMFILSMALLFAAVFLKLGPA